MHAPVLVLHSAHVDAKREDGTDLTRTGGVMGCKQWEEMNNDKYDQQNKKIRIRYRKTNACKQCV